MNTLKLLINRILRAFGYQVISTARHVALTAEDPENHAARLVISLYEDADQLALTRLARQSHSQLGQDLFALHASRLKRSGYFVEFGAGDGVFLSNTLLLERDFGWKGLLAEPLPAYQHAIRANRTAILETACVWRESGKTLEFVESGYLSTVADFRSSDLHASERSQKPTVFVQTISLIDLLRKHNSPPLIDFLSIDTEGSEFEILQAFPFNKDYRITAIACEHNFAESRAAIAQLLTRHGYRQVARDVSQHDDWFVLDAEVL